MELDCATISPECLLTRALAIHHQSQKHRLHTVSYQVHTCIPQFLWQSCHCFRSKLVKLHLLEHQLVRSWWCLARDTACRVEGSVDRDCSPMHCFLLKSWCHRSEFGSSGDALRAQDADDVQASRILAHNDASCASATYSLLNSLLTIGNSWRAGIYLTDRMGCS
jgi:hypothetical protein